MIKDNQVAATLRQRFTILTYQPNTKRFQYTRTTVNSGTPPQGYDEFPKSFFQGIPDLKTGSKCAGIEWI